MGALLVPLVILVGLFYIYRLMFSSGRRGAGSFNSRRARARAKSASSGNGLLMLAAVNLAALGYTLVEIGSASKLPSNAISLIVVVCLLGGVILLVAEHSIAESLIGSAGFGAALTAAGTHYGLSGVLSILVFSMIVLWFLGLVRALVP